MKKRIYISGAITGDPKHKERFAKAQKKLEAEGYLVVNPAAMGAANPGASYEDYMLIDLFALSKCDEIYMLQGWRKSCGANREYGFALGCGINIRYEQEEKRE